jgi:hypothetical protein
MGKADELSLLLKLAVGIGLDRDIGEVSVGERDLECRLNHGLGLGEDDPGRPLCGGTAAPVF